MPLSDQRYKLLLPISEILYLFLIALSFCLLFLSRTGEASTVWQVLHPAFLPTLFAATSLLIPILLTSEKTTYKLLFIIFHSILIHSLFSIIFPAGDLSGQQIALGRIRRLQNDALIHGWPPEPLGSIQAEIFARFGGINFQGAITIALSQMLTADLLWTHLFLVPILWGIFTPIAVYLATSTIASDDKVSVLASVLISAFPYATYFGAISVPNSLGYIFFFYSVCFMLRYLSSNDRKTLALVVLFSFFSLFAHYLTGIMSFSFVPLALAFKAYKDEKVHLPNAKASLVIAFIVSTSLLPLSLIYLRFFRPITQTAFTLDKFFELPLQEIISLALIGELTYGFDLETVVLIFVGPAFAIICMIYLLFNMRKNPQSRSPTQVYFLIATFLLILLDYRVLKLFMEGLPLNEERLWVIRDFLAAPFVAVAFHAILSRLSTHLGARSSVTFTIKPTKPLTGHKQRDPIGKLLILNLLLPILIGGWIAYSLNAAYPRLSPLQTTWYELEAMKSIDETTTEKYVVIGDLWTIYAGERIVGINNPRAYYFAEFNKTGLDLFTNMKQDPSSRWMQDAMNITDTTVAYFIVSEPRLGTTEFNTVVLKTIQSGLHWRVLGEGKLYIFTYEKT